MLWDYWSQGVTCDNKVIHENSGLWLSPRAPLGHSLTLVVFLLPNKVVIDTFNNQKDPHINCLAWIVSQITAGMAMQKLPSILPSYIKINWKQYHSPGGITR